MFFAGVAHVFVFFLPQPKQFTPQLTPRRPLNLDAQRSSLIFESCETISITSLGKIRKTFYSHVLLALHPSCCHTYIIIKLNTL